MPVSELVDTCTPFDFTRSCENVALLRKQCMTNFSNSVYWLANAVTNKRNEFCEGTASTHQLVAWRPFGIIREIQRALQFWSSTCVYVSRLTTSARRVSKTRCACVILHVFMINFKLLCFFVTKSEWLLLSVCQNRPCYFSQPFFDLLFLWLYTFALQHDGKWLAIH